MAGSWAAGPLAYMGLVMEGPRAQVEWGAATQGIGRGPKAIMALAGGRCAREWVDPIARNVDGRAQSGAVAVPWLG